MSEPLLKRATVSLPIDLDFKFRKLASQKYKFERGWYSRAVSEAMELWLISNEYTILNEGINDVTQLMEIKTWNMLKSKLNQEFGPKFTPSNVFDYFKKQSPYLELKYEMDDGKITVDLNKSTKESEDESSRNNILYKHLVPITMVTKAMMKEITGKDYQIEHFEVGKCNKVCLKKVE